MVLDLNTGECLQTLRGHTDSVRCIQALSEERIISASNDKTIRVWCLKTNSWVHTIYAHSEKVTGIEVLSNDQIASCSTDRTIKIWDLDLEMCIKKFQNENCIVSIEVL